MWWRVDLFVAISSVASWLSGEMVWWQDGLVARWFGGNMVWWRDGLAAR